MEQKETMEVRFGYTDEFGQDSEMKKSFDTETFEDGITLPFLVEQFKLFLLGSGFSPENIEKIQYNED